MLRWGVAAVILIIAVAGIVWWLLGAGKGVIASPAPIFAPQGQLVPQFPKGLILDNNTVINGSYAVNYSSSTDQYTAIYDSSSTMATLYGDYQSYLPLNNWTVTGSLTTHPTFNAIAASQGSDQLQIVISTQSNGSQVTITYVTK